MPTLPALPSGAGADPGLELIQLPLPQRVIARHLCLSCTCSGCASGCTHCPNGTSGRSIITASADGVSRYARAQKLVSNTFCPQSVSSCSWWSAVQVIADLQICGMKCRWGHGRGLQSKVVQYPGDQLGPMRPLLNASGSAFLLPVTTTLALNPASTPVPNSRPCGPAPSL